MKKSPGYLNLSNPHSQPNSGELKSPNYFIFNNPRSRQNSGESKSPSYLNLNKSHRRKSAETQSPSYLSNNYPYNQQNSAETPSPCFFAPQRRSSAGGTPRTPSSFTKFDFSPSKFAALEISSATNSLGTIRNRRLSSSDRSKFVYDLSESKHVFSFLSLLNVYS